MTPAWHLAFWIVCFPGKSLGRKSRLRKPFRPNSPRLMAASSRASFGLQGLSPRRHAMFAPHSLGPMLVIGRHFPEELAHPLLRRPIPQETQPVRTVEQTRLVHRAGQPVPAVEAKPLKSWNSTLPWVRYSFMTGPVELRCAHLVQRHFRSCRGLAVLFHSQHAPHGCEGSSG